MPKKRGRMRAIRDQLLRATKAKADAIIWLAESQEWDFFLAAMYELHRAGHNLWPVSAEYASDAEPDAMLDIYVETDRQVGRILDRINSRSTTVVIFALNGMEANRVQNHFLPEILSRLNAVYLSHGERDSQAHATCELGRPFAKASALWSAILGSPAYSGKTCRIGLSTEP